MKVLIKNVNHHNKRINSFATHVNKFLSKKRERHDDEVTVYLAGMKKKDDRVFQRQMAPSSIWW